MIVGHADIGNGLTVFVHDVAGNPVLSFGSAALAACNTLAGDPVATTVTGLYNLYVALGKVLRSYTFGATPAAVVPPPDVPVLGQTVLYLRLRTDDGGFHRGRCVQVSEALVGDGPGTTRTAAVKLADGRFVTVRLANEWEPCENTP